MTKWLQMQQNTYQIIIAAFSIPLLLAALWRLNLRHLKTYQSKISGRIDILQKYNGEKVLNINSYPQGVSVEKPSIKKSYWYKIAELSANFCSSKKNPQILMLGLGANTIPNVIAKLNPKIKQTLVEIDPWIIDACRKYFNLNDLPNYRLVQGDAFQIAGNKNYFGKKFDCLIVDIFTGHPPFVSLESNQPSFIEQILSWLKKDGMIIFNRPGHNAEAISDSKKLEEYLKIVFKKTEFYTILDPRGYKNNIIVGVSLR